MQDTYEFPAERPGTGQPGEARAAGLRRLSRLTWRATQLSALTAAGVATLFARTAPAQTAGQNTTAPAVRTSSAGPAPSGSASSSAKASPTAAAPAKSATMTIAARTFPALGTFATLLVTESGGLAPACDLLATELAAMDAACSRFRPDSELWRVNHAQGRPVPVSVLFADALAVALTAAAQGRA